MKDHSSRLDSWANFRYLQQRVKIREHGVVRIVLSRSLNRLMKKRLTELNVRHTEPFYLRLTSANNSVNWKVGT